MYILRFTHHLESDLERGWTAVGPQISDPDAGGAYPFDGDAYDLAEHWNEEESVMLSHNEYYAEDFDPFTEAYNSNYLEINTYGDPIEVRSIVRDGQKWWCEVDQRHDGLACYVFENKADLDKVVNTFTNEGFIIPDAEDNFATGKQSSELKKYPIIEQTDDYVIWSTEPESKVGFQEQLRQVIAAHLDKCCEQRLPRLKRFISTEGGRENAENIIFEQCKAEGIAVQTAMSNLDSEL